MVVLFQVKTISRKCWNRGTNTNIYAVRLLRQRRNTTMCGATPRYVPFFDDITCPHNITCTHLDDDRVRAKQLRISRAPRVPVDVDDGDIFHEIVQRDVLPERRAIPQFLRVLFPSHDEGRVSHVEQLRVPIPLLHQYRTGGGRRRSGTGTRSWIPSPRPYLSSFATGASNRYARTCDSTNTVRRSSDRAPSSTAS